LRVRSSHFDGLVRTILTAYRLSMANRICPQSPSHVCLRSTRARELELESRVFIVLIKFTARFSRLKSRISRETWSQIMIEPSISGWFRPRPEVGSVQIACTILCHGVCLCAPVCASFVFVYLCHTRTHVSPICHARWHL